MKKRMLLSYFPFLCLIVPLLSGCWDQTSIEERTYVVAVGLDKGEKEGRIKVTYLTSNPELSKQQGGTNEPPQEVVSFEANDIISSKQMANAVMAKEITYSLLSVFVVSEEFAKDEEFIRWMYDATKDREIKRNIPFIVTKESASEFLKGNKPKLETRIHKYFELILDYGSEAGYIPESDLHTYYRITEADADLFLAIYGSNEISKEEEKNGEEDGFVAGEFKIEGGANQTQFLGSAVFKQGKMIGKLTGEETRIAILLSNMLNMSEILATYPDPFNNKYRITVRIMQKESNDIKMDLKNGNPTIDVRVPLYVELLADHSMAQYAKDSEKRERLEKSIEESMAKKINNLVRKTQEEFKGEPFDWSLIARKQFLTISEYQKFNWMEAYPTMKVNVKVEIKLGKFGRQSEVPDLEEMRD